MSSDKKKLTEGGSRSTSPVETMTPEREVEKLREQVRELEEAMAGSTLKEGPAKGRRSELTPGRVVDFEEADEGDATRSSMSKGALEKALKAAEIRVRMLEERTPKRRGRMSIASEGGEGDHHRAKAKLERPKFFNGDYSELYNILNWLHSCEQYLDNCWVDEEEYSAYVHSYLGTVVQAWMDSTFPPQKGVNIQWETLKKALISRWLPPDHEIRLELRFNRTVQRSTLLEYVERFQVLDAAITFSKLDISDRSKVIQFLKGLTKDEDRYCVLEKAPKNLAECYAHVTNIRSAKTLTATLRSGPSRPRSPKHKQRREFHRSERRELQRLEGKEKQKAWAEGRCLNCGASGHMWATCPKTMSKSLKAFAREVLSTARNGAKEGGEGKKKPKRTRLHRMESRDDEGGSGSEEKKEEGDDDDEGRSPDSGSESEAAASTSENSDPEFEG